MLRLRVFVGKLIKNMLKLMQNIITLRNFNQDDLT